MPNENVTGGQFS